MEKTNMLGKTEDGRKRGKHSMRWMDSMREAILMNLQVLSRAVEDRTLWTSLIQFCQRPELTQQYVTHASTIQDLISRQRQLGILCPPDNVLLDGSYSFGGNGLE